MKKFIVTYNGNLFRSEQPKYEIFLVSEKETLMSYLYDNYIKDKGYWDLSPENFRSHYHNIGKRLETMVNDYAFTKRENNIELFDGEYTSKIEVFDVIDIERSYAIMTEVDICQSYIVTKKVYDKIINQIDNLRILYNELDGDNVDYSNEFEWLSNYESVFFSNEHMDYNDFDFDSGDIKDVNIIGGSSNTESSLEITLIDHFVIKQL